MIAYHGHHGSFGSAGDLHVGICVTDDLKAARSYAGNGRDSNIVVIELSLKGLERLTVESYDPQNDHAPGDDGDARNADVLEYADADRHGRNHDTVRLMSTTALEVTKVLAVVSVYWADALDEAGVDASDWAKVVDAWKSAGADEDDYSDYEGDLDAYLAEAA